jgi:hypothetical protein
MLHAEHIGKARAADARMEKAGMLHATSAAREQTCVSGERKL